MSMLARDATPSATPHVVILSIGPVQEQIQTARRSRDLWFGSKLLSDMGGAVARALTNRVGVDDVVLIFPHESKDEEGTPVGNKIVARVVGTPTAVTSLVADAARAIDALLVTSLEDALDAVDGTRGRGPLAKYLSDEDRNRAAAQVRDAFQVAWVAVEYADEAGEGRAIEEAERWLAARKNTRTWDPPTAWAQQMRPKSSMDGRLESVIDERFYRAVKADRELLSSVRLHPTERLSGLDLMKRYGGSSPGKPDPTFLSTTHVAATPWMMQVHDRAGVEAAWTGLKDAINQVVRGGRAEKVHQRPSCSPCSWDAGCFVKTEGQILYPGRLKDALEEEGVDDAGIEHAQRALRDLYRAAGSAPSPYYAVLQADGDRMGKFISLLHSETERRTFSEVLLELVAQVRARVEGAEGRGSLIYSGGDDVLALLPLDTAVETAQALATTFHAKLAETFPQYGDRVPTLSAGLAIAHAVDPLAGTLSLARQAEASAKESRNALAITMDRRSGAPTHLRGRWSGSDGAGGIAWAIATLVDLHRAGAVSARAGYELAELAQLSRGAVTRTPGPDDGLTVRMEDMRSIQAAEALRILGRKQSSGGGGLLEVPVRAALADVLEYAAHDDGDPTSWLGRALIIAREIAKAKGNDS